MKPHKFTSPFFTLYEVSENIFAAIEKEEMNVGSNAGFFDLGDQVVVFDTFLNIDAAQDLYNAATTITGKKVSKVVISHYHSDHLIGLPIFEDAEIISTPFTREKSLTEIRADIQEIQETPEEEIQKLIDQSKNGETEKERLNAANSLKFYLNIRHPKVKSIIPTTTVSGKMVIYGRDLTVELWNIGCAHSPEDLIAYFPDQHIAFMGDLLFANRDPWLGSGDPTKLIAFLEDFKKNEIDYYISGHGEIGTQSEVDLEIRYVQELIQLVNQYRSLPEDQRQQIDRNMLSPEFQTWNSPSFGWNVNFLQNQEK